MREEKKKAYLDQSLVQDDGWLEMGRVRLIVPLLKMMSGGKKVLGYEADG